MPINKIKYGLNKNICVFILSIYIENEKFLIKLLWARGDSNPRPPAFLGA